MECGDEKQKTSEWLLVGFVVKPAARQERSETAAQKRDLQQIGFRDTAITTFGRLFVMPEHRNSQEIDQHISNQSCRKIGLEEGHLC